MHANNATQACITMKYIVGDPATVRCCKELCAVWSSCTRIEVDPFGVQMIAADATTRSLNEH